MKIKGRNCPECGGRMHRPSNYQAKQQGYVEMNCGQCEHRELIEINKRRGKHDM